MAYPTGELTVDLHAITSNWRLLKSKIAEQVECGAVVKANAYGLGVDRIAPRLYAAGCRCFFVANLKEAIHLQSLVGRDTDIFVLSGCIAGAESEFIVRNIIPVIISREMLHRWAAIAALSDTARATLKVDTGMARLGLSSDEFFALVADRDVLREAKITCLMSHLACADERDHPLNAKQIERFRVMHEALTTAGLKVETSLSNSAGIFLNSAAHGDIVRPGIALYGGNAGLPDCPMQPVIGLKLPILQVRHAKAGDTVGYGATKTLVEDRVLATVSGGYADGIMRTLSNRGWGFLAGKKVPIVGRISMDTTIFDITAATFETQVVAGMAIQLLGADVTIDDLARAADTISYEILTSLGARYQRAYIE